MVSAGEPRRAERTNETTKQAIEMARGGAVSIAEQIPAKSKEFSHRLLSRDQVLGKEFKEVKWDTMSDDQINEAIDRLRTALKRPDGQSFFERIKFDFLARDLKERLGHLGLVLSQRQARRTLEETNPGNFQQTARRGSFDRYGGQQTPEA